MNTDAYKALIHSTVDHNGQRTYPVWVYDTNRPRMINSEKLAARYSAVRFIDTFPSLEKAQAVLANAQIDLLKP
jgi:hypothetical protein